MEHGKDGTLTYNAGAIADFHSVTLTHLQETVETTAIGDDWQEYTATLGDLTLTVNAFAQTVIDPITLYLTGAGTTGSTLVLEYGTTGSVSLTAICTQFTESTSAEGVGELTLEFVCSDADGTT